MSPTWINRAKEFLLSHIQTQLGSIKYSKNVFWLLTEKAVKFLAELIVGFYIARSIGVLNFGTLNYAISLSVLFQGISTLGLSEILTRELINFKNQQGKILGTALLLRLCAAVVFILLINLITTREESDIRLIVFIISLSLLFRSFEILTFYFQSKVESQHVARVQIVCTFIISIIKIYLVHQNYGVISFAKVYSLEWFLIALGLTLAYIKNDSKKKWSFRLNWTKKLISNSWSLMLSAAAVNLYMRIDQVMIREIIGDTENGYYAAALRLTEFWYIFPMILCSTFFPALLNARKLDWNLYQKRMLALNSFLFWASIIIAIIISPFAENIILLFYDKEYAPSSLVLSIQIWSLSFSFLGISGSYWLLAENLQYFSLIRTLIGLLVNLLFNFLLIADYGAVGAAFATLITQISATTLSLLLLKKTRELLILQLRSILYPLNWLKTKFNAAQ